jgi:NAD(P)-dependent dehydrogenase (short-subunit alcohol dehydrogenase family)
MARLIKPEEVAAAVGWLCRPEAASITGVALPIAGGEV